MNDIVDMSRFIEAKSDQLNADDLIGSPRTITVTKVTGNDGDQPISIHYQGDNGKPFKPCKTIRRVLMAIWGKYANEYVGKSMTVYRDDKVTFGGLDVGGIRISHMSGLEKETVVVVMKSKGKKAGMKILPLANAPAAKVAAPDPADDKNAADLIARINAAAAKGQLDTFLARPQVVEWRAFFAANRPDLSELVEAVCGPAPAPSEDDPFGGPDDTQRGETNTATDDEDADLARLLALLDKKVRHEDVLSLIRDWQPKLDVWSPESRETVAIAQDARVEAIRGGSNA